MISICGSDYDGPPEHYHEVSEKRFDIRRRTFTFEIEGEHREVSAGEEVTVPTDVRHTFSDDGPRAADSTPGDPLGVSVIDVEPPGRIGYVFPTFGGIAHGERRSCDALVYESPILPGGSPVPRPAVDTR